MAKHILSLESPDTMNACQIRIVDTSVYNPDVPIKCPVLQVTIPGFSHSAQFGENDIDPGFMLNLTACDLEVQIEGCQTTQMTLPDGIWVFRYSVSPNDQVFVEYNHLRITKALSTYNAILCELDLGACEPDQKTAKKLAQLREAKQYLEAAKAAVEVCHNPNKGMELYRYAVKLLGKFDCKTCQNH